MTVRPHRPVIPSAAGPARRRQGGPRVARPLPLAILPARGLVVSGIGRIDASGRVAARSPACWGWRGGDRLTLTASAGVMVPRRDPAGMITVPARPHIVIPAAVGAAAGGSRLE